MESAEIVIIGGGLIGLATAHQLLKQFPNKRILLLEQAGEIAQQQSNHTGIIASGILAPTNSLAAFHSRRGRGMLRTFCDQEQIPLRRGGQLFVASDADDLPNLATLKQRGLVNGVSCEEISAETIPAIEPHARGLAALHLPEVPIVDFGQIARRLAMRFEMHGGRILTHQRVVGLQSQTDGVIIKTNRQTFVARYAVNAAGSYADRLANKSGVELDVQIVPFRGEYWRLKMPQSYLCRHLVSPVPNLSLPFTGIHLARIDDGFVRCGPNAILAGGRRQRRKGQISLRSSAENLFSPAVRKLTRRYFQTALWEQRRSWNKNLLALTLQRLIPTIEASHIERIPASTQGYAITPEGEFVNDFIIKRQVRLTHILSTPNLGATACLSIGQTIANEIADGTPSHLLT